MAKLTKRTVDSVRTPSKETVQWDDELPGFGLRAKPSGARSYVVQYRNRAGRSRRLTLGRHGVLTPREARDMARQILASTRNGHDPAEVRERHRTAATVADFAERWTERHAKTRKKATSLRGDESLLRLYVLPALGNRKLQDVTRADVERLRDSLSDKQTTANRVLALLSAMFNKAEAWGERDSGSNPCRHVERFAERRRERPLAPEEIGVLWRYLDRADRLQLEKPAATLAIRLLLVTGCRLGEILTLRWEYLDLDRGVAELPSSKTGAKTVPLGRTGVELLKKAPQRSAWVLPGAKSASPLVNLEKPWRRIRKALRLEDVRLHDLRHSFATQAIAAGLSLPKVGNLLGHKSVATTARYAHYLDEERGRDSAAVDAGLVRAMARKPTLHPIRK